jgi:hypothetical protein
VRELRPVPSGLWEVSWRSDTAAVEAVAVPPGTRFVDCGTPAAYLAANLAASGGEPVIGPGSVVEPGAHLVRSVVWPGGVVHATERLVDSIRVGERVTVAVRP